MAKTLKVTDTLANVNSGPRTHEIIVDGAVKSYTFPPNQPLEMAETHARKFVPIDAFVVMDGENRVRQAISISKGFDTSGAANEPLLKDDECVARFEELGIDALLSRAAPLAGGEKLNRNNGKAEIIAFLIAARRAKGAKPLPKDDAAVDDLDEAEIESLVPRDAVEAHV